MPLIAFDATRNTYVVRTRKHEGKTIEEVAREDLRVLQWILTDSIQYSELEDGAAYYLEDFLSARNAVPEEFYGKRKTSSVQKRRG